MDDFASGFLTGIDEHEPGAPEDDHEDESQLDDTQDDQQDEQAEPPKKARGLRSGIFRAANLQDKLLEKLVSQVIPADDGHQPDLGGDDMPTFAERPGFSLPLMSTNFRRFNARIGVVFKFQARALRVLSWRRPTHTLSFLAVYTFVCLDPYLLFALPLAIALFGVLVPSFVARHPAPTPDADRVRNMSYSPRGPPLAPARTVKPTKELSRDFFRNMGDLQNVMEDFSVAHDKVIALVVPKTNFSDEALSSAVFVVLSVGCLLMLIASHLIPLRFLSLIGGWAGILSNHPSVARWINQTKLQYLDTPSTPTLRGKTPSPWVTSPLSALHNLLTTDILLDTSPETREVEIFELQHHPYSPPSTPTSGPGEWQPWLFTPSPYDPLSASRISNRRPCGARFFEDVLPPPGWEWSEKKWALDLWSREWVEERIITGVEVETEGERWVYDVLSERDLGEEGGKVPVVGPGWEEGEEGVGRRGQWRRRRWVRMVKRRKVTAAAA
ncbi:integral peroxisomal membrane peroxin-domain-containing protein [Staphylotrichum tortipilum]|uniref:Integral peroxisomal membrane peroxin-domain-containing protein n=1 Tax=Staphylotrichum tortipilum TaxID=2831512 RepID=A0AAN6MNY3_9PEZI|nr:integral peroxisomal membrane peroxin-domain-containing protein [Staphylotrichum longicolle]